MKQKSIKKTDSKYIVIDGENAGRRIDNYLVRYFKKMPKSRIYQMLRKGEVRVNKGRIKQTYRLVAGDNVRIPPIYESQGDKVVPNRSLQKLLAKSIIYEDEGMLVINKPAGVVVHGGSAQLSGVIETMRTISQKFEKLELVHRLDKDTSGCLILAKKIPILRKLHDLIKSNGISKSYLALLAGQISKRRWIINKRLSKNTLVSGERIVTVDETGKTAITKFFRECLFDNVTLARIELITGRTHQIRVHSTYMQHPIIGDNKYGNREINQTFKKLGLKRLFLHAASLRLVSPISAKKILVKAPLPNELAELLSKI